jgi:hypothetical protein
LTSRSEVYKTKSFKLVALGKEASFVASSVKKQLSPNYINCTIVQSGQPAQLSRLTYNRSLVGLNPSYSCIPSSAMKHLVCISELYKNAQGTLESDINYSMSRSVKGLMESGLADLLSRSTDIMTKMKDASK